MAIHIDKKGREWVGSFSKGLWRIKDKKVDYYKDSKYSYRNMVTSIAESKDGVIWVGTYFGLGRYNESTNSFTWYTVQDGLASNGVYNINFDERRQPASEV
jgi:ligand-binding sensor domain-containing protein